MHECKLKMTNIVPKEVIDILLKDQDDLLQDMTPEIATVAFDMSSEKCLLKFVGGYSVFTSMLNSKNTDFCVKFYIEHHRKFFEDFKIIHIPIQCNEQLLIWFLHYTLDTPRDTECNRITINGGDSNIHFQNLYISLTCLTWYKLLKYISEEHVVSFTNNLYINSSVIIKMLKHEDASLSVFNLVKKLQLLLTKSLKLNYRRIYDFICDLLTRFDKYYYNQYPSNRVFLELGEFLECVRDLAFQDKITNGIKHHKCLLNSLQNYLVKDLCLFVVQYL